MDTTIVATVMASHGRAPGALATSVLVLVRADGIDEPELTSAGMSSSMAGYDPLWLAMEHQPNGRCSIDQKWRN